MSSIEASPRSTAGSLAAALGTVIGIVMFAGLTFWVRQTCVAAGERLVAPEADKPKVATADDAEAPYCTPQFKEVLQRVLHSCGLMGENERRGCKPADVKTFASISDGDFNELFRPLRDRGAVILYDAGKDDIDERAKSLIDDRWADRRGARYFLVVGRASTTGSADKNRALSHRRANSVLFHIKEREQDPEIDKKVGLLWLGSEFAQLNSQEFCAWPHSREGLKCDDKAINQSAFASWVDCRL